MSSSIVTDFVTESHANKAEAAKDYNMFGKTFSCDLPEKQDPLRMLVSHHPVSPKGRIGVTLTLNTNSL